jgi:hypothetical protein
MSKIRAQVKTYEQWNLDTRGLLTELSSRGYVVDGVDIENYVCSDCNEEFEDWESAALHGCGDLSGDDDE